MKKNLRIVSAAAAALLAVAPVAAAAVNVAPTTVQAAVVGTSRMGAVQVGTVDKASDLKSDAFGTGLTDAQKSALRDALGVSSKIDFSSVGDPSVDHTNNAVIGYVTLTTSQSTVSKRDQQALKNFNGAKKGNQVTVGSGDNAGEVLANNQPIKVYVKLSLKKADSSSTHILAGLSSVFNPTANTAVTINAVAKNGSIPSAVNGGISVSLDGHNFDALLHTDGYDNDTEFFTARKGKKVDPSNLTAGHYIAVIRHATVTLGNAYVGKTETFTLSRGEFGSNASPSKQVVVDSNGVAELGEIQVPFYAYDASKLQGVHFYDVKTGSVVTSGSVTLHAVNGKLSVQSVYDALNHEYGAAQYRGAIDHDPEVLKPVNDIRDQLTAAKISVDNNGYFTAPSSFTINMHAKSSLNGAEATLPVTVNVDNATSTTSNEQTTTKTIMHIATLYDKNGKATNDPVLRAYNSVSVVATPVELKDASGKSLGKFYKIAGKDRYIKVGNIDGTVRTLKHNAYVYKSNGKARKRSRKHHVVRRSGSSITTYGKSFMIAGSQMYRVGRNQYIKKANFR